MRRGFKTHAKELALEVRGEIGLTHRDPFDPWMLAELYGIRVVKLGSVGGGTAPLRELASLPISGALVPVGTGAFILENDHHTATRCRLTVSHEMSHVLLEHKFGMTLVDSKGCRTVDADQEDEANFLSGELVLPFKAAMELAWAGASDDIAARTFGISVEAARWRMNASGARKIVSRSTRGRAVS